MSSDKGKHEYGSTECECIDHNDEEVTITDDDIDDEILRLMDTSLSGGKIESKYVEPEQGDASSSSASNLANDPDAARRMMTGDIPMSDIGSIGQALHTMTNNPSAAMKLVKSGLNHIPEEALKNVKDKARKGTPPPMVGKLLKGKHKEKLPDRKHLKAMEVEMRKHTYAMAKEKESVGLADNTLVRVVTFGLNGRLKERLLVRRNFFGELNRGGTPIRMTTVKIGLCVYVVVDAPKMKQNKRASKFFNYKLGGEVTMVPQIGHVTVEQVEDMETKKCIAEIMVPDTPSEDTTVSSTGQNVGQEVGQNVEQS